MPQTNTFKNQNGFSLVLLIVLIAAAVGIGAYIYSNNATESPNNIATAPVPNATHTCAYDQIYETDSIMGKHDLTGITANYIEVNGAVTKIGELPNTYEISNNAGTAYTSFVVSPSVEVKGVLPQLNDCISAIVDAENGVVYSVINQ